MARSRKRKSRRGLGNCPCGVAGLGMETPSGHLTIQGKPQSTLAPAGGSRTTGIIAKVAIVAAAAGAGWFGWQWWQKRNP